VTCRRQRFGGGETKQSVFKSCARKVEKVLCGMFFREEIIRSSLALLEFHGAFFVVVDSAVFAFGAAEGHHFLDDLGYGVGIGTDRSRAGNATERSHPAFQTQRFLSRQKLRGMVDHHNGSVAKNHIAFLGEIKGTIGIFSAWM